MSGFTEHIEQQAKLRKMASLNQRKSEQHDNTIMNSNQEGGYRRMKTQDQDKKSPVMMMMPNQGDDTDELKTSTAS